MIVMSDFLLASIICNGRNHVEVTQFEAYRYCTILAVAYVASLYCLVPPKIRRLHNRDDPIQIQWRGFATAIVCVISYMSYRILFCESFVVAEMGHPTKWTVPLQSTLWVTCGVIVHTSMLYFGEYVRLVLLVYEYIQKQDGKVRLSKLLYHTYLWYINPIYESIFFNVNMKRWIVLRNLVIAPITEEIVFRVCMVSVLHSTGMETSRVCFVAPLFFGFAHVHHAALKLSRGNALVSVVLTTTFQFTYTSIFGAYASYIYQRSASLVAVVLCHSMCNALGFPDFSFIQPNSSLYRHRMILLTTITFSLVGFILCMVLLELPPRATIRMNNDQHVATAVAILYD